MRERIRTACGPGAAGKCLAPPVNTRAIISQRVGKLLVSSVNGNRHHFELGLQALSHGEAMFPGVTQRILTNPVAGLDNYQEMMRLLVEDKEALKVFVNIGV